MCGEFEGSNLPTSRKKSGFSENGMILYVSDIFSTSNSNAGSSKYSKFLVVDIILYFPFSQSGITFFLSIA